MRTSHQQQQIMRWRRNSCSRLQWRQAESRRLTVCSFRFCFVLSFLLLIANASASSSVSVPGKTRTNQRRLQSSNGFWVPVFNAQQGGKGGGKARTKAPTPAPMVFPTRAPSPPSPFPSSIPPATQSPTSSPSLPGPAFSRTERIENGQLVQFHSCGLASSIPVQASPVVMAPIEFLYKMEVFPGTQHSLQIPALEAALSEALAELYLDDCRYNTTRTPFRVYSVSSLPYDRVTSDTCGSTDCRFVRGGVTLQTFYVRRRLNDILVLEDVATTLQTLLPRLLVMEITWLEFVALAEHTTPVVPAAVQQSPSAATPVRLSWGAAVLAVAGTTLLVAVVWAVRFVGRKHSVVLHHPHDNDRVVLEAWEDRYTYEEADEEEEEEDDGVRPNEHVYVVNDLMLDHHSSGMMDETGRMDETGCSSPCWSAQSENPPLFVQVGRSYQTPDTLDL